MPNGVFAFERVSCVLGKRVSVIKCEMRVCDLYAICHYYVNTVEYDII